MAGEQNAQAPSSVERVRTALRQQNIDAEIKEFPASTRTAADAAAAIGTTVSQIVKSLVFLAGGDPVLALVSGSNQLDTDRVGRLLDARVERADADAVRRHTGFAIGGVPPCGFEHPLRVLVDRDLLRYSTVWAAAGTPHHVFEVTPEQLIALSGGEVAHIRR